MADPLAFGNIVSFQVYGGNIIGNDFRNVKVIGIYSADNTRAHNYDPIAMHQQLYPHLPDEIKAGVPDRYSAYAYYQFEMASGERIIVGAPYIVTDSIEAGGSLTAYIEVADVNASDLSKMTLAIAQLGYKVSKADLA